MGLLKKLRIPLFIIVVVLTSLVGFVFFTATTYSKMNDYDILTDIFKKTNAEFILGEVHINENKVSVEFPNENDLLNYLTNNNASNTVVSIESFQIKKYICEYNNSIITLFSRTEDNKRFFSVTVSQSSSSINFDDICTRLVALYKNYHIVPICASSVCGEYEIVLTDEETEKITSNLLGYMKAVNVKKTLTGNTLSITGVSPSFSNQSIKNINFNLGIRSSRLANKTYITLATPIIINEY